MKQQISYISFDNQNKPLMKRSEEILNDFLGCENYCFNNTAGQLLFVASGGSEQNAVELTEAHKNIILLCHRENNSYAAAIEIAAYLRAKGKRAHLINVFSANALHELIEIQKINSALETLASQKAALIGEVSDWLIISDVSNERVKERLGIQLIRLPWEELANYQEKASSDEFLNHFPNFNPEKLIETSKVFTLLQEVISYHNLSAISVECFSMVVRDQVTACLPLAVLNKQNLVAACEGDICSMLGKMIIRALTNQIPWQANVAEIRDDQILFAHCTAPLNLLKSFEIKTHFETNCGTAIQGKFEKQEVGVFRINNELDKFMLIEGEIVDTPNHNFACRTQIVFKTDANQIRLLKEQSLGNHQIIFPASYIQSLLRMMQILEIKRVQ